MNGPVPVAVSPPWEALKRHYPGVALCGVLALAGSFLAEHYGAPALLLALLLGFGFSGQAREARLLAGVGFCARRVLRLGVALLGARIGLAQLQEVGLLPLLVVLVSVPLILGLALWLGRWLGLPSTHSLVGGAAVAICGVSAAVAVAAALPAGRLEERRLLGVVVCVTALGTLAMLAYPPLVAMLGYGDAQAGLFLGATIHDVAQAAGAGYLVSDAAGDVATLTKLLRVALLVPLVLLIGLLLRRGQGEGGVFPWFLLGFVALFVLNSLELLSPALREGLVTASHWCLLVTMAALGMRTSIGDVLTQGWRPLLLLVLLSGALALLVMTLLAWLSPIA
ncbi:YeiH family protein [Halomonas heilongjiangensis]|uniref:Putative sulfate exporter family transporter n=1 Tax=Halomonas heilongjiangensis TaxID=1387883 RepID=A0A2N7TIU8_9GAMM|nr:putative sulfate exporter family transporter [Halomonas heilongjiangensis]PMR68107.1 putative sulfate exporter family transporter [Halomonas heilongjiangensis]PXX92141.1 putative sulfate exporter family transporter [Halomonas heilongjiangensis]